MEFLNNGLSYFLSFKPYVMLPIIIFVIALVFRLKPSVALTSSLQLGIAFIGIFMTFDYFVGIINPAMTALISRFALEMPVLDTGWPPLAAATWAYPMAPVLLLVFLLINGLALVLRLTKTVNIDIWNYWHPILLAAMVDHVTGQTWLAILVSCLSFILVLKMAEWAAPEINKLNNSSGITIPHLSALAHWPLALAGDWLLDRIPGLKKINANAATVRARLGLAGEPMILGLVLGLAMGLGAGYELRELLSLAIGFAAVVFLLPRMGAVLGGALVPISEGMKVFIAKHFKGLGTTYIGLDVAVLFAVPCVLVVSLFLMPVSIVLAVILPGITFIPVGDLTNLLVPVALISVATRGNMVRTFIIGIPLVIINLYYASMFAPVVTAMARKSGYVIPNYDGVFTSFMDAGNPFRSWVLQLLKGDLLSLVLIPVVGFLIFFSWKVSKKRNAETPKEN